MLNAAALKDVLPNPQNEKDHCLGAQYLMNRLNDSELLHS